MKNSPAYLMALVVLAGCTRDIGRPAAGGYPLQVSNIIMTSCAVEGCHNAKSREAAGGLDLSTWDDLFKGSNSGAVVIPYSGRFSPLFAYINTHAQLGAQSLPTMPLNAPPLSIEKVRIIRDWIENGAPDVNGNTRWAQMTKKMYVVNQGCGVVTVMDRETMLPAKYVAVGDKQGTDTPHSLRVSPDGKFWYVIFIRKNVMEKYSCDDDSYVGSIPLTPLAAGTGTADAIDWNTFVISRDGKRAYCVSFAPNGKIAAVDLERMKLVHFLGGLHYSHGVSLNGAEDKIYIGTQNGNFLTEIDTGFTITENYPLEASLSFESSLNLHDIILSPDGKELVITCQGSNDVRFFSLQSKQVSRVVKTGIFPQEIVYSSSRKEYYVSCTEDTTGNIHGSVTRINGGFAAETIPCGFQPHGIAVDEERQILYVASRNYSNAGPPPHHSNVCGQRNGFVNFIDLSAFTVFNRKYEVSGDPYFIFAR